MIYKFSIANTAKFLIYTLQFGLVERESVKSWADNLILNIDNPDYWFIELSLAPQKDIETILNNAPGTCDTKLSIHAFLGFVARKWRKKKIKIDLVRAIGWYFHVIDGIPELEDELEWGATLECECHEFEEGWRNKNDIEKSITDKLSIYEQYEIFTLNW